MENYTRTSSFITEVFLFKPVEIMSRSKYYNFAIKMLCDIHIERNYNVNYWNPSWLRDRVFVIFAVSSAFRL